MLCYVALKPIYWDTAYGPNCCTILISKTVLTYYTLRIGFLFSISSAFSRPSIIRSICNPASIALCTRAINSTHIRHIQFQLQIYIIHIYTNHKRFAIGFDSCVCGCSVYFGQISTPKIVWALVAEKNPKFEGWCVLCGCIYTSPYTKRNHKHLFYHYILLSTHENPSGRDAMH